ncbi:MAG: hypothetical protein ACTSX2_01340 [Candidatus Thorarchaeota archaeon]
MSQDFFDVEKGLQIDSGPVFLVGSGVPGSSTDTDNAVVGSHYRDTANGNTYIKDTAGTGTDKWEQLATQEFVNSSGLGVDWKDSVRVATAVALPSYVQAGAGVGATLTDTTAGVVLTIDGIAVALGDRVLVKDEAGAPGHADHGLYEVTQVGIAASVKWELTRTLDADEDSEVTANMAVGVEEGTIGEDTYWAITTNGAIVVDTTQIAFAQIASAATEAELGFIRTFIGKSAAGSETPTYSSNNYVTDATSLETAIGALDAQLGTTQGDLDTAELYALKGRTESSLTNVTTIQVLDSILVDAASTCKWTVHCEGNLLADAAKKRVVEILGTHDGHINGAGADATDTDYTVYAKLKMGNIVGLTFTVDVSGSGVAQVMNLKITSTTAVDVRAVREFIATL